MHRQQDVPSVRYDPASATPVAEAPPWPGVIQRGEAQPGVTARAALGSGHQQYQMQPAASNDSGAEMRGEKLIPFPLLPSLPFLTPSDPPFTGCCCGQVAAVSQMHAMHDGNNRRTLQSMGMFICLTRLGILWQRPPCSPPPASPRFPLTPTPPHPFMGHTCAMFPQSVQLFLVCWSQITCCTCNPLTPMSSSSLPPTPPFLQPLPPACST